MIALYDWFTFDDPDIGCFCEISYCDSDEPEWPVQRDYRHED